MTFKIILLLVITVCALIAVFSGFVVERKEKKKNGKKQDYKNLQQNRTVIKIRLICFLIMLVCLFICIVI